jgi:inhibitor of KinA sporulation pathway (predicted exonuclease)
MDGVLEVESEFGTFVRPVVHPLLSDFCLRLTSIRQSDVDAADPFPAALSRLLTWIGSEPFTLCSWGGYDLNQLRRDCERHGLHLPSAFERHINLKQEFGRVLRVKPCGMAQALEHAGLPLEGTHHRGADDARNVARLAMLVLPRLGSSPHDRDTK